MTDELARGASVLVTMRCGEDCPVVPGARRIDWSIADPKGLGPDDQDPVRFMGLKLLYMTKQRIPPGEIY